MNPAALTEALEGFEGRIVEDAWLAPLTTYRLGGPATLFVEPATDEDVARLAGAVAGERPEVLVLGRGSNIVISDRGFPGVVVRLHPKAFGRIAEDRAGALIAGAGAALPQVANFVARRGLAGAEFLIAIPGSVGGAVRMNAGAHGRDMSECLSWARIADLERGEFSERPAVDLDLAYRHSNLTDTDLVTEARLELSPDDPETIKGRTEEHRAHRAATQPPAVQNAGSTFKNPDGDHAGRLVEAAGLKGFRVGGVAVSELHANFFVSDEGATAQDVYDLVAAVRARVQARFGVELEPEVRFVGEFEERVEASG